MAELRSHQWFRGFNFDALQTGNMPAPFIPNLRGSEDDANFGPIDWRGEPVLTSPEYDVATWDQLWDEGGLQLLHATFIISKPIQKINLANIFMKMQADIYALGGEVSAVAGGEDLEGSLA